MTRLRSIPRASVIVALFVGVIVSDRPALSLENGPECARWRKAFGDMPTSTLRLQSARNGRIAIVMKVAATDETRWAGFQCATPAEIMTTVILFDFGGETLGEFHMRNVPAPLDIAFAKESGRIFSILRMDPSPTALYGPMGAYRYAIEARAGFFKEQGILPGDRMLPRAK